MGSCQAKDHISAPAGHDHFRVGIYLSPKDKKKCEICPVPMPYVVRRLVWQILR